MQTILKEIQEKLRSAAKPGNIDFFKKMVPGNQKIYGVKTPVINALVKEYEIHSFELAEKLWNSGALEEKIMAIKIIEKVGKKDPARTLKLFRSFAKQIDNWAICDGLGMQFLRGLVKTHTTDIFSIAEKLNGSSDPWQRRLSLVMVEWFTREKTHTAEIKKLVKNLESDDEYYVKKAIVWINKNFKKQV
jgi:3-methyladenine DNA glycosylase AlkD